jgi:hypothetical protein
VPLFNVRVAIGNQADLYSAILNDRLKAFDLLLLALVEGNG